MALCLLALPTMVAGFVPAIGLLVLACDLALLVLVAVDFGLARSTSLRVWRTLPPRFQVGVKAQVSLHLVHSGARTVSVSVRDHIPESFVVPSQTVTADVPGKSRVRVLVDMTPSKRGKFFFDDICFRVSGPLSLVWHERRTEAGQDVAVYPDMRGASRLLLADAALDFVNLGLRQLRKDGRGSEFARLRDYAQGDSARDVDWKATARRGKPVTRVMESERSQTVLIGVDAGRAMAAQSEGLTKLDHAVNAALFLAFVAVRNGDRVGLVVFADGVKHFVPPAQGRLQYRKLVEALYATKAGLTTVDFLALFKELNVRLLRRSLLCIFTDFLDEDQASTMVLPFQRLAKRHVSVCLSVRDESLQKLLLGDVADGQRAFQQAVANELLLERETAKRKLAKDGVRVIDVDAHRLSVASVNVYLDIKSRGVL